MDRAYSTLEIKALEADGKRRFSGTASTPTTDRMGDIVEPKGAEFKLPLPLLWQHNSREPVGWVTAAKVTDKGIEIEGELAVVADAGKLKERLDEAWQMLKAKLVRGLSIGFTGVETARIEGTYGYRYLKWSWLELSCVTIPANADCSITAIKSADQALQRAASGARPVVRLNPAPTASGNPPPGDSGTADKARRKGVVYLN
jgi:HK97 family phage prohead protease